MNKIILKIKNKFKNKRVVLTAILFLLIVLFVWGIKATYAYYNSKTAFSLLGTTIGNFDIGDGDINLIMYKEDDNGEYNLTKSIPLIGYYLNDLKTDCSNENTIINYIEETNEISIQSNEKTVCRIYFDQLGESDVRTYILLEDDDGEYLYENINYKIVNQVPDVGYDYVGYDCLNKNASTNIEYDSELSTFTYKTSEKNICYVYFNKLSNPDLIINIYVQETDGSDSYMNVINIPTINKYVLSDKSTCVDVNNNVIEANISYLNREIEVLAEEIGTCNVYLDISN